VGKGGLEKKVYFNSFFYFDMQSKKIILTEQAPAPVGLQDKSLMI